MKISCLQAGYAISKTNHRNKTLNQKNSYAYKDILNRDFFVKKSVNITFTGKDQSKKLQELIDVIWSDENLKSKFIQKIKSKFISKNYMESLSKKNWEDIEEADEEILSKSKKIFEEKSLPKIKKDMFNITSLQAIKLTHKIASLTTINSFDNENSLKAMLEYIKMLKIATKKSASMAEKEKIQYDTCRILGKFIEICKNIDKPSSKWIKNRFNKEAGLIMDYHFGKYTSAFKENTTTTNAVQKYDVETGFCFTPELRKELKEMIIESKGDFRDAIINVSGNYDREIYQTIYELGILTPKAQKQLSVLIALNKKGLDLTKRFELPVESLLLFEKEKIQYYKQGKLTPAQAKLNKAKKDNDYEKIFRTLFELEEDVTTNTSVVEAALNFFKKNGLDLSDLSGLEESNLKKAFKKLAIKLHPDQNGNSEEAKDKFQTLFGAHKILSSYLIQRNQSLL